MFTIANLYSLYILLADKKSFFITEQKIWLYYDMLLWLMKDYSC